MITPEILERLGHATDDGKPVIYDGVPIGVREGRMVWVTDADIIEMMNSAFVHQFARMVRK